jgi:hypothetical protein
MTGIGPSFFALAPPRLAAEALRRAGFAIVSTANTHAWDGDRRPAR